MTLQAPFPYFGGKSKIAADIWRRLGNPPNYVEPFLGSAAVLLARPDDHLTSHPLETVNDKDGFISNFWRAVQHDPEQVASYADYPINENDLHARHAWLVGQHDDMTRRLEGDPEWFDAQIAGWWVWGMCLWIGSGFCSGNGPWQVVDRKLVHLGDNGRGETEKLQSGIYEWFDLLQARLRHVRVCSGDWSRVMGPSVTEKHGLTGIVLDPPYDASRQDDLYRVDSQSLYAEVRQWAIEHGTNPLYRIAYCGYEDGFLWPDGWTELAWKGPAGFDGQRKNGTNENRRRERVWFSPHCLQTVVQLSFMED